MDLMKEPYYLLLFWLECLDNPSPRNRGAKQSPELMPTVKLPERKVPKGEKPNMLDVAGGAKTLRVAKGGMVRKKKPTKKSKVAGRAAKRGYGMAKRGK